MEGTGRDRQQQSAPSPRSCGERVGVRGCLHEYRMRGPSPRKRGEVRAAPRSRLQIQRLVAPKNAVLVEGDTAVAGEIGLEVGSGGDAVVQIDQAGNLALEGFHAFWKGVAQAFHDLEQRQ